MPSTETFQHYQVLKKPDGALWELGRGAMGVTYKAFDTSLRCHVALKVINTNYLDSEMAGQRFLREARAAAGLSHPNVAGVFHLGQEGGNYFYAMEYINGETVESFVKRRGPLPPIIALKITLQVARALRAAARVGLVHRDIKPANLMLVKEDEEDTSDDDLHVKVIDFGLAKVTHKDGGEASATITVAGFVGTPHFASPEQLEEKDLDTRSDIYSLGVTMWYMLAGKPPFSGSMVQIMSQHLTRRPPFNHLSNVPPPVLKVLESMLEKDPTRRPQSPMDLRKELEQAIFALGATTRTGSESGEATSPRVNTDREEVIATPTEVTTDVGSRVAANLTTRIPEIGTVLDARYQLVRQISQSQRGVLFQATEVETGRTVAVKILSPELLANPATAKRAQAEFGQTRGIHHPAILQVYAFVSSGVHTFIAHEWINGFTLVDVLRQRPVLGFNEVMQVLKPVAAAADALKGLGIASPEIDSSKVLLSIGNQPLDLTAQGALANAPLTNWPVCEPKIFPLQLRPEPTNSVTWGGQQTIVPIQSTVPSNAVQLALLAYELLGGNPGNFVTTRRCAPLPSLTEQGNDLLRDILLDESGARDTSATAFVNGLCDAVHPGMSSADTAHRPKRPSTSVAGGAAGGSFSSAGTMSPHSQASYPSLAQGSIPASSLPPVPPTPVSTAAPTSAPVQPSGISVLAILGGAFGLLVLLGALAYVGLGLGKRAPEPKPITKEFTPAPMTPQPTAPPVELHPTSTPMVRFTPSATPAATPVVGSTPRANPTPAPPSRDKRLADALAAARRMQENHQTAEALAAYVQIAEEFPESDTGFGRIDSYVSGLASDSLSPDLEQRRFQQLRPAMERAAKLGSDQAMLYLGEHLLTDDPDAAADWIRRAADKGRPEAMLMLGDMYFRGIGVPNDPSQSARWYEMASDKGLVKAKLNLAECYEVGKGGVQRDYKRAFELLGEALNLEPNNPRALEKVALAYEAGHGTPPNTQQAFTLMKRASELGNANATANLGAYYMKGLGTVPNERMGAELFKQGAGKDNAASMFFYAQCLDAGIGGIRVNKAEAANYYKASAERGYGPAKDYCQQHRIRFVPKN